MGDPLNFVLSPDVPIIDQHFLPFVLTFVHVNPVTSAIVGWALFRLVKLTKTKKDDKALAWLWSKVTGKKAVIEDGAEAVPQKEQVAS